METLDSKGTIFDKFKLMFDFINNTKNMILLKYLIDFKSYVHGNILINFLSKLRKFLVCRLENSQVTTKHR